MTPSKLPRPPESFSSPWLYLLDRYGLSTVILIAIIVWAAPKIDLLINTHLQTVRAMEDVGRSQQQTLAELAAQFEARGRQIEEIHRAVVPTRGLAVPATAGPVQE